MTLPPGYTLDIPSWGGPVRVVVYDLGGRAVRTLEDGWQEAGAHSLAWDGRDATGTETPAGLYFIRAEAQGHRSTLRLVRVH